MKHHNNFVQKLTEIYEELTKILYYSNFNFSFIALVNRCALSHGRFK